MRWLMNMVHVVWSGAPRSAGEYTNLARRPSTTCSRCLHNMTAGLSPCPVGDAKTPSNVIPLNGCESGRADAVKVGGGR